MSSDEQELKLLSIFHYIVGALAVLFACFPLIHVVIGAMFIFAPGKMGSSGGEVTMVGWLFMTIGLIFFVAGQAMAVCIILSGRYIAKRTRYTFVFVIAAVECLFMPFGTVLGVLTLIVLSRESVKKLFGQPVASSKLSV